MTDHDPHIPAPADLAAPMARADFGPEELGAVIRWLQIKSAWIENVRNETELLDGHVDEATSLARTIQARTISGLIRLAQRERGA